MKKYYFDEHEDTYQLMKSENISAWDEFHDPKSYSFDQFMMRPFLDRAFTMIDLSKSGLQAFEYGCGTGAGACYLANRGFTVDAVDISPTAIQMAAGRNPGINFRVQDLLELTGLDKKYDLILDNYCLQSIVTDEDRAKLFSIVSSGLKASGYYIVSSAIFNGIRTYENSYYDSDTGIVYEKIQDPEAYGAAAVMINGEWWLPHRRHRTAEALREELQYAGFQVVFHEEGSFILQK
ncbi:class I SAM-dependent methyltransferase [Paenibacillus cremeus]|uniref:Class I SAM-dependent methyltransferase n=1 Tax=Paenibacillus cremeus TaxID=2163881 RepID=A0A559KG27_9BACL|nr:class I SAM-dependent methyltransferase [Paenibacillus cremeus]TVY11081.1 class I SAM-dependent methyltransferase [Paenibacillus cremeus]